MKKHFLVLVLLFILIFPYVSYADSSPLSVVTHEYTLDMWHHSGGYWRVGNLGSDKIRISDSDIASLGGMAKFLEANELATFETVLPDNVKAAYKAGKDVRWELVPNGEPLECIFDLDSLSEVSMSSSKLVFSIKPRFNFSGFTMNDYVSGISAVIPLIDREFGYNAYAVYGQNLNGTQFDGRFYISEPNRIVLPFIHPLMIEDSGGNLQSGFNIISGDGTEFLSEGLKIGDGTFSAGGACGLSFSFPVGIKFYIYNGEEQGSSGDEGGGSDEPGEGGGSEEPGEGGSGEDEPGEGESDEDDETHSIDLNAVLDLPSETYEGHSVEATDCSSIVVDDTDYSPDSAFQKGIASHGFTVNPSSAVTSRKLNRISNELTFDNSGNYSVKLTIRSGSVSSSDTKSIVVRRCPYIMAAIGGLQKQNRRQVITGSVAQNPKYPISELTIKITEESSGEAITINKHLDGSKEDNPVNSTNIKYRSLVDAGSDKYFVRFSVEFLTKFKEDRNFILEVTARDTRGNTDSFSKRFFVVKDKAPVAAIDIEEKFYRGENGKPAVIEVKDASSSDGDKLIRRWEYSEPGKAFTQIKTYEDLSFGSLQDICFKKADVGWFNIRLTVRDDWKDDTLPEYISEADYLSDSTEVSSMVDNIAPAVSLTLKSVKTAEILLLADDAESLRTSKSSVSELKMKLLESGIDARINIASLEGVSAISGRVTKIGTRQSAFGFQGRWPYGDSFWEMYNATADEERMYKAECTWPIGGDIFDCYASQPYIITAYDKTTLNTLWTLSLSESFLKISFDEARYGHDFENRYLYIIAEDKTILIEKSTGAFVAAVDSAFGFNNSVTERNIYTYKNDGIYRYPRSGGTAKKIVSGTFFTDADKVSLIKGKVNILMKNGSRTYVAHFDPQNESITYTYMQGTGEDQNTLKTRILGFDSAGAVLINVDSQVRVFDSNGMLIKSLPGGVNTDPIYDSSGRINYISKRSDSYYSYKGDTAYYATVSVYGIYNNFSSTQTIVSESDYPTDISKVCVSLENGSGIVYVACGACFDYVRGLGMPYGQRFKVFVFNTKTGDKSSNSIDALAGGLAANIEWGYQSLGNIVLTTSYNIPTGGYTLTYLLNVSENRADRIKRLQDRYFSYETDFSITKEISGNVNVDFLARQIIQETSAGRKKLQIKGTSDSSGISKAFTLEPGTTYYYEYDTDLKKDTLSVSASYSKGSSKGSGFAVQKECFEDFNDNKYNSAFTFSQGKVKDSVYYMVDVTAYGYINKSGSISFTVPSGFDAAISFDYTGYSRRGNGYSYFTLSKNGGEPVWWESGERPAVNSISGNYTSKHLLSPGNYVLNGNLKSYSNYDNNTCYLYIDNIKLLLLRKNSNSMTDLQTISTNSHIQEQNGLNHISGSFSAPLSIYNYGLYETDNISGGSCGESHTYNVPSSCLAIYQSYVVNSSPYQYYTSQDKYRSVSVSWLWGDDRWNICASGAPGSSQAQSYPASGLRITKYNLTGTQTLQGNIPYRTSGNISSYQIIQSKPDAAVPSNITSGKFFIDEGKIYFQDISFNREASVTINTGKGDRSVSNFCIYSIEDGKRVYLYGNSFKSKESKSDWNTINSSVSVAESAEADDAVSEMLYEKGEYIAYDIIYSDYENDPSRSSYWQYVHTPYNDGLNPISNAVLTEPVNRLYYDGKYELYHWQYDKTGNESFDKKSNICKIVFYIRGETVSAPWIEYIDTSPVEMKPGEAYTIDVGIADSSGKTLKLFVELYYKGELIETFTKSGITPDNQGSYPVSRFLPKDYAKVGSYDVIATVSSDSGYGMDDYHFVVKSTPSLEVKVDHTIKWEANRNEYNIRRFGRSETESISFSDYAKLRSPRRRYSNVYWPEERFVLTAVCGGEATSVNAVINGSTYSVRLEDTGITDFEGKKLFSAEMWHETMPAYLKKNNPKEIVFTFTAHYKDGKTIIKTVSVIVDYDIGYYRLHRKW